MKDPGSELLIEAIKSLATSSPEQRRKIEAAIEDGTISPDSSPVVLRRISGASPIMNQLGAMVTAWKEVGGEAFITRNGLAVALATANEASDFSKSRAARLQIVWSGPTIKMPGVRTTSELIREIIRSSKKQLLIVGYALTSQDLIKECIIAMKRGVRICVVIHDDIRNRNAIRTSWPEDVSLPEILVWTGSHKHRMAKMHMKLVVGDGKTMLVTSANITYLAMHENMELGVHVSGSFVTAVVHHFSGLQNAGILNQLKLGED